MITIKKYQDADFDKVIDFLRQRYLQNGNMTCWLPARFQDLIFRVDTLYRSLGKLLSKDFIFLWEEAGDFVAVLLPDGDSCYTAIKSGYEYLFPQMVTHAENHLKPLFTKKSNGKIDFLVVSHDKLPYQGEFLQSIGYVRGDECDYDNVQNPQIATYSLQLPQSYKQIYGEAVADNVKSNLCHFGFHPSDCENLYLPTNVELKSYLSRKDCPLFASSFESIIATENDLCAYSFCYVDEQTKTAFIEPVCVRKGYRRMGLGRAMLQAIINRLNKTTNVTKCYVNSFGEQRRNFYNSAGFQTEDTLSYWFKEI